MSFPFNLYLLALLCGAAITALSFPFWRRFCLRIDLVDDPGHRKIHSSIVPLAGGLAVFTGLFLPLALGALAVHFQWLDSASNAALLYGFRQRALQLSAIFI